MNTNFQWQLIEMLPVVEGRSHEILTEAERQWESLEAMKHHPHALDLATTERLLEIYETKADHLQFLKTQALRWRQTALYRKTDTAYKFHPSIATTPVAPYLTLSALTCNKYSSGATPIAHTVVAPTNTHDQVQSSDVDQLPSTSNFFF